MSLQVVFTLVLVIQVSYIDALQCRAGTPTLGKLTEPNLPDTQCDAAQGLEDVCYVMYTDYDNDNYDAWTYGCIIKGSLDKCDQSFKTSGVTNNYCCCKTAKCNNKDFAAKCGQRSNNSEMFQATKAMYIFPLLILSCLFCNLF